MLQRTLLRSSRSLSARIPSKPITAQLRASSPFIRPNPSVTRAVAARWYSDAAAASPKQEAKQAEGEKIQEDEVLKSATSSAEGGGNNAEVEKLKTELEAKKKEIINLKVAYANLIVYLRDGL